MTRSIWLIANPVSGSGRARRALPAVRRAFDAVGVRDVALTTGPGDEARLVRRALDGGADTIAILGGDGTLGKATAAILAAGAGHSCRAVLLAGGTGNDFVFGLGLPGRAWVTMARLAAAGHATAVDCVRVDGRHVLNVAGLGFDVAVLQALRQRSPLGALVGGAAAYRLEALRQIVRYRPIRFDPGDGAGERELLHVALANGRRYGGGIHIAPGARTDDGLLDVVAIEECAPLQRFALFQAARSGRHVARREVRLTRTARVVLHFPEPPVFQADGELYQAREREVVAECVPAALRVVTPAAGAARS